MIYTKIDKKQKIPDNLKKSNELLIKFESNKFRNIMTLWNRLELRDVIMNLRLQQKFIESGYSTKEFGEAKRNIALNNEELKLVNMAVFDIWKFCIRNTSSANTEDIRYIDKITKKGFSFMDILLIHYAKKLECKYFITKDNKIKKSDFLSEEIGIKIIGIKEFLSILNHD